MAGATVGEALGAAVDALRAAGVEEPRLDAELLLAEATGLGRAALVAGPEAELAPAAGRSFGELVRRRLRREPVAYILGCKGFRRLELAVDRRVLVPRPESELLVDVAIELRPRRVLDIGTGSGAIALAVADELPGAEVVATDTSHEALAVARANAARLGLDRRVRFEHGTLPRTEAPPGTGEESARFDLVLANLPYVAERDWPRLQPEVTHWEPRAALLAGPDGLDAYRALLDPVSVRRLSPSGLQATNAVALEVGEGQAPAVAELVRTAGFAAVRTRRDLAGIERVVVGQSPAWDGGEA